MSTFIIVAMAVLSGLITILVAVSPLTKSDLDNRALDVLRKVRDAVAKLIGVPVEPKA